MSSERQNNEQQGGTVTVAVVWREPDGLWAVADTRLSGRLSRSPMAQLVTDHGPKLFPLAVTVWRKSSSGFFNDLRSQNIIGYLYAGFSGPALATHALCAAVLQSLITRDGREPTLAEVAEFIRTTADRYMRDWGVLSPAHCRFCAFVFGWCNVTQRLETYQIVPSGKDQLVVELSLVDDSEPKAIGSGSEEFSAQLEKLRTEGDPFGRTARLPLLAVERLVQDEVRDDVGGDIQLGVVTHAGLKITSRV